MYYIAENLELRHDEVAQRIADMCDRPLEDCKKEVDLAIQRLFYWGAYADKYGGQVQVGSNSNISSVVERSCGVESWSETSEMLGWLTS